MRRLAYFLIIAAALFAACGGGEEEASSSYISFTIDGQNFKWQRNAEAAFTGNIGNAYAPAKETLWLEAAAAADDAFPGDTIKISAARPTRFDKFTPCAFAGTMIYRGYNYIIENASLTIRNEPSDTIGGYNTLPVLEGVFTGITARPENPLNPETKTLQNGSFNLKAVQK
ncbi:MAG: hypothetical protein LBC99_09345 [Spirochaetota bacterium]|jgi:hypothetical protein|nr:hypothetical protein [Spirochaetota bacterium]